MAAAQAKVEEVPIITFEEFLSRVRAVGVGVEESAPLQMPTTPEQQWALLKPHVGKPLKDIPKSLVLLFTSSTQAGNRTGKDVQGRLRTLPAAERQVMAEEEVFI
jgi:hypothetical protein